MTAPIELTYKNLNDKGFIESMRGLVNHKWDAMTTAYKLKKIMDKIDSESKKAAELYNQEFSKIEMVEVGEKDGPTQRVPKDGKAFEKFQQDFLAIKCEMGNRFKLHVNELVGYKFSALDFTSLDPVLTGFEVLEKTE